MGLPNTTYIDKYITDGQQSVLSLKNFYETILIGDIDKPDHIFRAPLNDFFIKHRDQLSETDQWYNVPESMFYKPKMVSYELYGTTEMWLALLRLNNMINITEFHSPMIKIYNPYSVEELISIFFKREGVVT